MDGGNSEGGPEGGDCRGETAATVFCVDFMSISLMVNSFSGKIVIRKSFIGIHSDQFGLHLEAPE